MSLMSMANSRVAVNRECTVYITRRPAKTATPSKKRYLLEGWKRFFENIIYSTNFDNFCKFKTFWFLQKPSIQVKKIFWNSIIWYAFYSKFATFTDFEKIGNPISKIWFCFHIYIRAENNNVRSISNGWRKKHNWRKQPLT